MISVMPKSLGVNTAATPWSTQPAGVGVRDDPADDDRHVAGAGLAQQPQHLGHQLAVRAGQDRQPDAVHALLDRGRRDLGRREPDALVDHLEAGVAGAHGDLLGTVGVPVQAGLADQQPQPGAELVAGAPDRSRTASRSSPGLGGADGAGRPRWAPGRSRTPRAARRAHSPVVTPARAQASVAGIRFVGRSSRRPAARPAPPRPRPRRGRPARPAAPRRARPSTAGSTRLDGGRRGRRSAGWARSR